MCAYTLVDIFHLASVVLILALRWPNQFSLHIWTVEEEGGGGGERGRGRRVPPLSLNPNRYLSDFKLSVDLMTYLIVHSFGEGKVQISIGAFWDLFLKIMF